MFRINNTSRGIERLIDLFLAESYEADNVADFVENRKNIRTARTVLPPGVLYWGCAGIWFPRAFYRQHSSIWSIVSDTNIVYWDEKRSFSAYATHPLFKRKLSEFPLSDNTEIYNVLILYRSKDDDAVLLDYSPGPRIREGTKERESIKKPFRAMPALAPI